MLKSWGRISGDEYKNIIKILEPCMDDHLYIMDIRNDSYSISESAVERFNIPGAEFNNAAEELLKFTYIEDRLNIHEEMMQIARKEKEFHNLQYRWLDRQGHPIWINCRGRVLFGEDGEPEYLVGCINEIGKKQKAKPGDILGAIAGESGMPGKLIGTIDMYDKYTFVEVPREYAHEVLAAMKNAKIKGKKVAVEPANSK